MYTDHKNLTYKNFNTDRVLRWYLILEEYGPELIYIHGEKNIVVDALSRLDFDDSNSDTSHADSVNPIQMAEAFGLEKEELPADAFPLTLQNNHCKRCENCQIAKRTDKKYGLLPVKEAETIPWQRLCVNLIGCYEIRRKGKPTLYLWCITMIDQQPVGSK